MKKAINIFAYLFVPLAFVMGIFLLTTPAVAKAEETEQVEVTETEYSSLWLNELSGGPYHDSSSYYPRTGNWNNVPNGGRIGYNNVDPNSEIKVKLKFSGTGQLHFIMRASGDNLSTAGSSAWTNKGYWVRLYSGGRYELHKNGTTITPATWPSFNGATSIDTEYTFVFRTINLSDGSVKISVTRNGNKYFEYIDKEDPILTGNWFAMTNAEGSAFSTLGNETISQEAVNVADLATPALLNGGNFGSATLNDDNSVSTTSTSANPAGLAYSFQQNDLYAIKTKFKPSTSSGSVILSIGSKNGTHAMNRPNVIDATWGWADNGYLATWSANGAASISRNNVTIASCGADANYAFEAGKEYEVSMGAYALPNGQNRVWLKVDDQVYCVGVDGSETKLNLKAGSVSTQPATLVRTSLVLTNGVAATISSDKTTYEEKTLASVDLSSPIGGSAIYDRNGTPTSFGTGIAVVYGNVGSTSIKFNANFTSASYLIFQTRATGTVDTPWGGGWTNKGYCVYVYANGQTILSKSGSTLCQGFGLTSSGFTTGTDYLFEIKTINLGTNATKVQVLCNGNSIINYVDFINPVLNAGTFQIFSDGTAGSTKMVGYEKPTLSTNIDEIEANDEVTMSYSISNPQATDVVTYHIDESATTAQATLSGDKVIPTTGGTLALYTCVNGMYSDNVVLTVAAEPVVTVTNLPTEPIIVGGETYTVDGAIDKGEITTKVFSIENLTGKATINAETGEITPIAAGNVNVFVTINGIKSQAYLVAISPKIIVKNTRALAVGEVRSLGYEANCDLPEETITMTYEIVDGAAYADIDTATGVITAKGLGIVTVRVTVTGTTFQGISPIVQIAIEAPVVVLHGVKDMYVGQSLTLQPAINEGVLVQSQEFVVVSGGDKVIIEDNKITATQAGTVKIKAIINGEESQVLDFEITELTATLVISTMTINDSQTLSVLLNFEDVEILSVVYSIEDGEEYARIEDGVLYSNAKRGDVLVKAVITVPGKELIAIETVSVVGEVRLVNISSDTPILVGAQIQLSYHYLGNDEVASVKYVLVEGEDIATLSENGLLEAKKAGIIKLKVVVNDKESEVISVRIDKVQDNVSGGGNNGGDNNNGDNSKGGDITTLIVVICSSVVAAVVATVVTLLILKKKKGLLKKVEDEDRKDTNDEGEE